MKRLTKTLAVIATTLTLGSTAAMAETRLTMSSWVPTGHPLFKDVMKPWAESVEVATEGRVKVVILPSPLGHPKVHYDLAREGQADITYSAHGYTPGRFKLYKISEFPFTGDSAVETSVALWNVYNKYLEPAGEYKDVKLLGLFTHGPGHIHNSKRTVNSSTDMKGLKLRVGGGIMNDMATELGAVTMLKPSSSTYELVSSGVADGTLFPLESIVAFNLQDKLTHTTLIPGGLYRQSFYLVMNKERFESLPEEDQKAIESISGEAFARLAGKMWDTEDAKGLEVMKANGNEIITADDAFMEEIRKASEPMIAEWVKTAEEMGIDGQAALEAFQKGVQQLKEAAQTH